ncbi:flagellar hook-associated protein FlgL [Ruicaihuangia caeni]|uniref:flagellar hook-associated protein FlgL n=1 Tax=Ruicaihuangia caeni TaxID=3042517 RepID=UPI00338EDD51
MISRTPGSLMASNALMNLNSARAELARRHEQASSQRALLAPSDDPAATATAMQVRSAISSNAQHARNLDDAKGWLSTVDGALASTTGILQHVRDLTVRGANQGALSSTAREAIAAELDGLADDLLAQANTQYLGRSVFAGTSGAGVAFTPAFAHTGTGSPVERRIADNTTVRVDADGAAIFGTGTGSIFALVRSIADDLRAGTPVGAHIGAVDSHLDSVLEHHAAVGARHNQIMRTEGLNMADAVSLEAARSGVEDVDLAEAIMNLQLQQTSYQAALHVTSRVLQPTLMDFLA